MLTRPCPKCNAPIDLFEDHADAETVIYGGPCDTCGEIEAIYNLSEINVTPKPRSLSAKRPDEYIAEDEASDE